MFAAVEMKTLRFLWICNIYTIYITSITTDLSIWQKQRQHVAMQVVDKDELASISNIVLWGQDERERARIVFSKEHWHTIARTFWKWLLFCHICCIPSIVFHWDMVMKWNDRFTYDYDHFAKLTHADKACNTWIYFAFMWWCLCVWLSVLLATVILYTRTLFRCETRYGGLDGQNAWWIY